VPHRRGERHPLSKWTRGAIDAIRDMYADGYADYADLARLTGQPYVVSQSGRLARNLGWISMVVTEKIWRK